MLERSTYALYHGMLHKHVPPLVAKAKLEGFDADAVDRLYERMRENGTNPSVINSCARILRAVSEHPEIP